MMNTRTFSFARWSSNRLAFLTMAFVTLFAAGFAVTHPLAADGKTEGKLLRHVVLYKFKEATTPAQVQEVVDAFSALPGKVKEIADFECGVNVSPEGKSEGLTHAFVVSFRTEVDRDAYLKHPAHDAYVLVVKDKREKVVVFDYWK
jgi:hypothetical protein